MTTDELGAPLGLSPRSKKPRRKLPHAVPQAVAGVLVLCLVVFGLWVLLVDDPYGGEPMVVVSADARKAPPQTSPAETASASKPATAIAAEQPTPGTQTVNIIDGMSGKREAVQIPASTPAAAPAESTAEAVPADPRIVEASPHGPIPKIGPEGARAAKVYAQPVGASAAKTGPRVVIVLAGLGVGAAGTAEALDKLPGPVTLAFVPYGTDLPRWVGRARREGHEVLLQVPMEPFDYPDNDPGPQTLLTTLSPEQNTDRLHWFMSRFQGYVGIANYMGARFTANESALGPVMRDAAKRGLIYFDDATSQRSVAGQIAGANNAAFAKADLVLDAVPTPAAIDGALARLEVAARERGFAVGAAKVSPAAIDRIAKWMKAAEGRGIVLVPLSAVADKAKSS